MSVSSLTKMTTPLASDQSATSQGLLMPKLSYRFRVVFENLGVSTPRTELTKQVKDFKRPNPTFEPIVIDVYNSKVKLAGKPSWAEFVMMLPVQLLSYLANRCRSNLISWSRLQQLQVSITNLLHV